MIAPTVLKSIKPDGWPDVIHAGKAVIRFPNGVESGNWQTRPDLEDDRTTPYTRADIPPTLAAALAVPEIAAIVDALRAADWYLALGHDRMAYNITRAALAALAGKGE